MKRYLLIALFAIASSIPALGQNAEQANQNRQPDQKPLTAEDFLQGRVDRGSGRDEITLLIQINEKLPPYRFHLMPELNASARGNNRQRIGRIRISKGDSQSVLQTIDAQAYADSSWFTKSFNAQDVNFDGYLDIAVLDDHGAKWGSHNYWLFDKRTGRFIANSLTNQLREIKSNNLRFDPKTKEIRASNLVARCADSERIYKIVRGHLVLMQEVEREALEKLCRAVRKKLVNGKMEIYAIEKESLR